MFAFVPLNQFTIVNIPSPTRSENVKNGAKLWEQPIVPVKGAKISKQQIEPEKNGIISQHQLIDAENFAKLPCLLIDSKAGGSNAVNEGKYDNEEDIHICGKCRQEFTRYDLFILHKKSCSSRLNRSPTKHKEKLEDHTDTVNSFHNSPSPSVFLSSPAHQLHSPTTPEENNPKEQTTCTSINEDHHSKESQNISHLENHESIVKTNLEQSIENHFLVDKESRNVVTNVNESSENVDDFVSDDIYSIEKKEKWKYCSFEGCIYKGRFNKDVVRHYRTHSGAKPWKCDVCDKQFARKDKLSRHMSIHSGEKKHSCIYCPYKTYEKSHLNKHMRIHTGETPYSCKVCSYKSKSSSQLRVHMRIHTGETPFSCSSVGCESTFKTSSDLNRHKQIHASEKPYSCDICGHKVSFKGNLKTHMKKIHNVCI